MYYNNPTENADQQVRDLLSHEREQAKVAEKLALIKQYGEDNFEDGTILKFSKRFEALPKQAYSYAVLRVSNQWYATGILTGFKRGTWEELVLALVSGEFPVKPSEVFIMSQDPTGHSVAEVSTFAS